ncbi:MAG: hypothetical protein IT181_05825 [Acidobacteria bacterium]|nr:hypothetical protein [Acidobacteriota bacterium]
MNCDLHSTAAAHRDGARACATGLVAPAVTAIDQSGIIPATVRDAARAVVAPAAADGVAWVAALEELAVVSAAVAFDAAGQGAATATGPQWPGLRGADVDGLTATLGADAPGQLAVTAVLVGLARAAVELTHGALRAARAAGQADDGGASLLADAATSVDGARLLLWDAARQGSEASRAMARLQAIEAMTAALAAANRATDAEASRPGAPLERLSRDAATAVRVFGAAAATERALAAAVLPA